ncbi:oxidoreductase [Puteibacter caeruleilacunae]|nr:oxidoreductase [Puteibacter caeruleilacunae]
MTTTIETNYYTVQQVRHLTDHAFVVRVPRNGFDFKAGQHMVLGMKDDYHTREYSIYSGEEDEFLEVLVKEVEDGYFSPKLKSIKPGDEVEIHGPFGQFGIDEKKKAEKRHVFIASGSGIAPFHSYVVSHPDLDYTLLHGVRNSSEAYERDEYEDGRYVLCTSRDESGDFHGRVTGYLSKTDFDKNTHFYLCGNSQMIFDALEILKDKGFKRDSISAEVYF